MRDVQRRLTGAGFAPLRPDPGRYCAATAAAVRAFQEARGLRADGVCDECTWLALVEAGYQLGDRPLHLRRPLLRGDDVTTLQLYLGRLGFDTGRVDGIFGRATARAVEEFQRNIGLPPDGVCGHETVQILQRLGGRATGPSVSAVREAERLRGTPRTLAGRRVVVGDLGGATPLCRSLARHLRGEGAVVAHLEDADGSRQAAHANRFAAEVYLGFSLTELDPSVSFFGTPAFTSPGGEHLAGHLAIALTGVLSVPAATRPMRLPVLRETRMTAVLVELAPPVAVVRDAPALADALARAVAAWAVEPCAIAPLAPRP